MKDDKYIIMNMKHKLYEMINTLKYLLNSYKTKYTIMLNDIFRRIISTIFLNMVIIYLGICYLFKINFIWWIMLLFTIIISFRNIVNSIYIFKYILRINKMHKSISIYENKMEWTINLEELLNIEKDINAIYESCEQLLTINKVMYNNVYN